MGVLPGFSDILKALMKEGEEIDTGKAEFVSL